MGSFSPIQRQYLISHIDGPVPITVTYLGHTRAALLSAKLLMGLPEGSSKPTHTALTEGGRRAVSQVLAEAADALILAGCLDPASGTAIREWRFLTKFARGSQRPKITLEQSDDMG